MLWIELASNWTDAKRKVEVNKEINQQITETVMLLLTLHYFSSDFQLIKIRGKSVLIHESVHFLKRNLREVLICHRCPRDIHQVKCLALSVTLSAAERKEF